MLTQLTPQFTELIPDVLEEGILYISEEYSVAAHLCTCGCKKETITPFCNGGWEIEINKDLVSLSPSIGNFNFDCKSHYYIKENQIINLS